MESQIKLENLKLSVASVGLVTYICIFSLPVLFFKLSLLYITPVLCVSDSPTCVSVFLLHVTLLGEIFLYY